MSRPIIIFGAGPLGRLAKEIFEQQNAVVYGFLDEREALKNNIIDDVTVLANLDDSEFIQLIDNDCDFFIALDDNRLRENIIKKIGLKCSLKPLNAIHTAAIISPRVTIGCGNFIDANTQTGVGTIIGNYCMIQAQSVLGVNVRIADHVQIGVGSILGHDVVIEKNVFLGNGVNIPAGIRVGEGARIGAGSVVMTSVARNETLFGNPAKTIDLSQHTPF